MNALKSLGTLGQAVWLDFLARQFLADGGLARLVAEDGLTGVTSNPSIFEKAIGGSADYDAQLRSVLAEGDRDPAALYEELAIADIRHAADQLKPVFTATDGRDGFVSLEVSPYLARDTEATVAEARRLWKAVARDNLMVKVPGTPAGLPAIRQLLGEGININITLLFSQEVYDQVAEAYLGGLEEHVAKGGDPRRLASVASFFVSRIDTAVDKLIEAGHAKDAAAMALRGKVAVANAKLAYRRFKGHFSGARWAALEAKGARPQRLLWASTGTKNKAYNDVLYVDELIGADTVNTMPPSTLDAFRDHGQARLTIEEGLDEADRVMAQLARLGVSIDAVTQKLVDDGVALFAEAFDALLGAVAGKRVALLDARLDGQTATLPDPLHKAVAVASESWRADGAIRKLWAGDAALWTGADEAKWLGWLDIVAAQQRRLDALVGFAEEVRREGFSHVLLLGMGGSSLGPEVLGQAFGHQPGFPELVVLDSTDPEQIRATEQRIDLERSLFIVSSKSGTTLEPNILKQYFFDRATSVLGAKAASRFVAVTDPGSAFEKTARADGFRHIFFGHPTIGGRYSVLSDFGIVPAAAIGVDLRRFLDDTQRMVRACDASAPPSANAAVQLGLILGEAAKAGRDKVTIVASPGIADVGAWLEQLIAESTGKTGKGLIPLEGEPLALPAIYGDDRIFVSLQLDGEADAERDAALTELAQAGHPIVRIAVGDRYHLGQEFFRWEMATAVAGAVIGINPFDQPDVEASKIKTRELTDAYERSGRLPPETPLLEERGLRLFIDEKTASALDGGSRARALADWLNAFFARLGPSDYFALLAYLERNERNHDALQEIRLLVRDRKHVATCLGFGPRFLHSTGQVYKGGPNSGVFLQLTSEALEELPVPGQKYGFGIVKAAQARGDLDVLLERGRRALRIDLGRDLPAGLVRLRNAIRQALG